MKHRPFYPQSNFTIFSNYILDVMMPSLKPTHWKILCFIIRKTIGWQKEQDILSYSQIAEGTGVSSRATINDALNELSRLRYISVVEMGIGSANGYRLNTDYEIEWTSSKNEQVVITTSSNFEQVGVQNLNTQKKGKKSIKERGLIDPDLPTPPPAEKGENQKKKLVDTEERDGKRLRTKIESAGFMYFDRDFNRASMLIEQDYTDREIDKALQRTVEAHVKQIEQGSKGITAPLAYLRSVLAGMVADPVPNQKMAKLNNGNVVDLNKLLEMD